mgnify:CR=1 FL=1
MVVKVSIVIPIFNSEMVVMEAVDSCINQTYENIEIIVIDDGSTDGSRLLLNEYILGGQIKYYYQENKERSAARNFGLDVASGDYINFLDSDDVLYRNKIEKEVFFLERNKDFFATYSAVEYVDSKKKIRRFVKGRGYSGESIMTDLVQGNFVPIQSVLFRKNSLRFNELVNAAEDWEYFLEIFYNKKVNYLNEILSSVRLNKQGTQKYQLNMRKAQVKLLYKILGDKRYIKLRGRILGTLVKYVVSFLLVKIHSVVNDKV